MSKQLGNVREKGTFWLWTTYEVTEDVSDVYKFDNRVEFAQWQLEKGNKSNRLHHQGFIKFKIPTYRRSIMDVFPPKTHIERVNKVAAAEAYTRKCKTRVAGPWTYGIRPLSKSKKTDVTVIADKQSVTGPSAFDPESKSNLQAKADLDLVRKYIVERNLSLMDFMMNYNVLYKKYKCEIKEMISNRALFDDKGSTNSSIPRKPCTVFLFTGDPGTGKSTIVETINQLRNRSLYAYEGNWWQSYGKQESIFIDELVKGKISFTDLNCLIDKRLTTAEAKNSHRNLVFDEVFLASNYEFEDLFMKKDAGIVDAVRRRITVFGSFRLNKETKVVSVTLTRFNTETRTWLCTHAVQYNLNHKTFEEGRILAKRFVETAFLNNEAFKDLFE
jgi:hypothetical protein